MPNDEKKHIDEGWKEEARREKERLAKEEAEAAAEGGPEDDLRGQRDLPPASFELLVVSLAIQSRIALGEIANPVTRRQEINLEQAKHAIDLLGMLEEKTKGNLTDDEKSRLESALYDLRMRYVQVMQAGM